MKISAGMKTILLSVLCIAALTSCENKTGTVMDIPDEIPGILEESVLGKDTLTETEASSGDEAADMDESTISDTEADTIISTSDMLPETSDTFSGVTTAKEPANTDTSAAYTRFVPLTDEVKNTLCDDYAKYIKHQRTAYDVNIVYYYGTYDRGEVVVMYAYDTSTDDVNHFFAGGYDFCLPSGSYEMTLHTDSTFIPLDEAYKSGLLSDSDMAEIHYHAENSETAQPLPTLTAPELKPLAREAERKIKEDFCNEWGPLFPGNMTADDVSIVCYYGTYDCGTAVVVYFEDYVYTDPMMYEQLGEYWFAFPGGMAQIALHTDSGFTPLQSAYEKGLISDDDLREIHYHAEQLYPWYQFGVPELYDLD